MLKNNKKAINYTTTAQTTMQHFFSYTFFTQISDMQGENNLKQITENLFYSPSEHCPIFTADESNMADNNTQEHLMSGTFGTLSPKYVMS